MKKIIGNDGYDISKSANINTPNTGSYLNLFLCLIFFKIMLGLIMLSSNQPLLTINVTIVCSK